VVLTIGSLALGIGMGASAAVSRAIGKEDYGRVRRLATDSLLLGLLVIIVVVPMIGNNVLRATGDTRTPGFIMMLGATINFPLIQF